MRYTAEVWFFDKKEGEIYLGNSHVSPEAGLSQPRRGFLYFKASPSIGFRKQDVIPDGIGNPLDRIQSFG